MDAGFRELTARMDAGFVAAGRDVLPASSRLPAEVHEAYDPSLRITPDYFGIDLEFDRFDRMLDLRLQLFEWRLTARLGAIMAAGIFFTVLVHRLF